STGNYGIGGAYVAGRMGVKSIVILPEEMSQERFDMIEEYGAQVIKTPGCESNVKEIYDKVKELMALCIGITVRCDGCIMYHVNESLKAGATYDEIVETIGVAVMMGGGPSVMYGSEALAALEALQTQ
ncbi:MAG: pyridoxal-phosphate dependent enzyme, partial [Candidatus Promineifilaceae bacterium]